MEPTIDMMITMMLFTACSYVLHAWLGTTYCYLKHRSQIDRHGIKEDDQSQVFETQQIRLPRLLNDTLRPTHQPEICANYRRSNITGHSAEQNSTDAWPGRQNDDMTDKWFQEKWQQNPVSTETKCSDVVSKWDPNIEPYHNRRKTDTFTTEQN